MRKQQLINTLFLSLLSINIYAQSVDINSYYNHFKIKDFKRCVSISDSIPNQKLQYALHRLTLFNTKLEYSVVKADTSKTNPSDLLCINRLINGQIAELQSQKNEAFKSYSKAYHLAIANKNHVLTKLVLLHILDLIKSSIFIGSKQYSPYLEHFSELSSDENDRIILLFYKLIFYSKANRNLDIETKLYNLAVKELDLLSQQIPKNHSFRYKFLNEKGISIKIAAKEMEDAKSKTESFTEALQYFDTVIQLTQDHPYLKRHACSAYWQKAQIQFYLNNTDKAKALLKISEACSITDKDRYSDATLWAQIYAKEQNYQQAYHYLKLAEELEFATSFDNNSLESAILSVQNETDRLKINHTQNQERIRRNRNIAVILACMVLLVAIIAYLLQKNTKRKQLLAEQEKALESQKLSTVLKEQELKSIDAMIAGQEKERQRIANDLHDDLGSLMANVKLHFDALKDNPSSDLYTKANSLIETAYDKIRGMAHAKNSGVMANKGLLKAINDIANSNSIANKLHIQVVDYGLEQQLENSLELTIFRIIQELIANIVKHAEATEATIHITNHENTINLMVEDNGKGFDTKAISQHQGMGIHSIDKRIENLGGTVTIESEINKGTTVIIDIPTL